MDLIFEWNARKARLNRLKHGIDFDEAQTVFDDPNLLSLHDEDHSEFEDRTASIGTSARNRTLLVVHTETDVSKTALMIRIISCRKATATERKAYRDSLP